MEKIGPTEPRGVGNPELLLHHRFQDQPRRGGLDRRKKGKNLRLAWLLLVTRGQNLGETTNLEMSSSNIQACFFDLKSSGPHFISLLFFLEKVIVLEWSRFGGRLD